MRPLRVALVNGDDIVPPDLGLLVLVLRDRKDVVAQDPNAALPLLSRGVGGSGNGPWGGGGTGVGGEGEAEAGAYDAEAAEERRWGAAAAFGGGEGKGGRRCRGEDATFPAFHAPEAEHGVEEDKPACLRIVSFNGPLTQLMLD